MCSCPALWQALFWMLDSSTSCVQAAGSCQLASVLSMASAADLERWQRLDDVIMGGQSSSSLAISDDQSATFSGTLVLEGGGFCGARTTVRFHTCS